MAKIIFFGSDQYSTIVLDKLNNSQKHSLTAIITTRPKTEKRTGKLTANQVEKYANMHQIKLLYYPPNLTDLSNLITSETYGVSASFGRILDSQVLKLFTNGIYNLHPSLLPQYRNVAPVPYALAMGDQITGISLFKMDEKIDNGQITAQVEDSILPTDTSPILLERLFALGSKHLIKFLNNTAQTVTTAITAKTDNLIFTRKLTRFSGFIEWSLFQKYLSKEIFSISDTANPLLTLRLSHHPERNSAYGAINDLSRALNGWEKLWTKAPGKNGELEIYITSLDPLMIQIPGKPKPITYPDFVKYYL